MRHIIRNPQSAVRNSSVIIESLRIRQWIKNLVVLAPLVFSGRLGDPAAGFAAMTALIAFCLMSSAVYLLNDLVDRRVDRFHPVKRKRPIASGRLAVTWAAALVIGLSLAATLLGFLAQTALGLILLAYLALNLAYSLELKRVVIVDAMALSAGFVLRIWGGAVVLGIVPSHWLQLSVFFLALFLSLAKRRQELVSLHHRALQHRGVLAAYSLAFLDQATSVLTSVAILCYALYSMSPDVLARVGRFGFIATVPFVVYGFFRYLYLTHVRRDALDPTDALVTDRPLLLSVLLWGLTALATLYR